MITVESKKAYYPEGKLPPPEKRPANTECVTGRPKGPNLTNGEVESHDFRFGFDKEDGVICIRVMPGEALGEVYVNIQYEGPIDRGKGEPNLCMKGQNDTLLRVSAFLKDLFGDVAGKWKLSIDSQPCPKADDPPRLHEAAAVLEGRRAVENSSTIGVSQTVDVTRNLKR